MRYLLRHPEKVPKKGTIHLPESHRCSCLHLPFDHDDIPEEGGALRGPCKKCPPGVCESLTLDPHYIAHIADPGIAERFAEATKHLRPPHERRALTEDEAKAQQVANLKAEARKLGMLR